MSLPDLLRLPTEIRLHIYEYVIGSRVVHVRMTWAGVCIPSGFAFSCLDKPQALLAAQQKDVLAHAVPFGADVTVLNLVCRQMYKEASVIPFRMYIWAFESAFTLDQFVCMKRQVSEQCKMAIRTVAVPTPGPHQSSERKLLDLTTVLLIGTVFESVDGNPESNVGTQNRAILTLRKSLTTGSWVREEKINAPE